MEGERKQAGGREDGAPKEIVRRTQMKGRREEGGKKTGWCRKDRANERVVPGGQRKEGRKR